MVVTIRAAVVIILEEFEVVVAELVRSSSSTMIGGQKQLSKTSMYELVLGNSLQ